MVIYWFGICKSLINDERDIDVLSSSKGALHSFVAAALMVVVSKGRAITLASGRSKEDFWHRR